MKDYDDVNTVGARKRNCNSQCKLSLEELKRQPPPLSSAPSVPYKSYCGRTKSKPFPPLLLFWWKNISFLQICLLGTLVGSIAVYPLAIFACNESWLLASSSSCIEKHVLLQEEAEKHGSSSLPDNLSPKDPLRRSKSNYFKVSQTRGSGVADKTQEDSRILGLDETMGESFSACLLINDENHRLPEWIAYHYFMLPLRHLVIMVDPRSRTFPGDIVDRWRPFLSVELWSNGNANASSLDLAATPSNYNNRSDGTRLTQVHRIRQSTFYRQCALHFHKLNRTWVSFHDVDEYVYLDPGAVPDARDRMIHPGSVLRFLQDFDGPKNYREGKSMWDSRLLKYGADATNRSCITVARTFFGSIESHPNKVQAHVPNYLNGSDFETLRWMRRNIHRESGNGHGKSIVHVNPARSSGHLKFVIGADQGVHRVLKACPYTDYAYSPIRIRHYVGSWEAFTSRFDVRRSSQLYEYRSQFGKDRDPDDDVRMWLTGFCLLMNNNRTLIKGLLQGAGQIPPQSAKQDKAKWSLSQEELRILIITQYSNNVPEFVKWLRRKFVVRQFQDGTFVVRRKSKDQAQKGVGIIIPSQ